MLAPETTLRLPHSCLELDKRRPQSRPINRHYLNTHLPITLRRVSERLETQLASPVTSLSWNGSWRTHAFLKAGVLRTHRQQQMLTLLHV